MARVEDATVRRDVDFARVARIGAEAAEGKKAGRLVVLDMQGHSEVSDFFVLADGKTRLQTRAIANAIDEALDEIGLKRRRQGYQAGGWVLLDYGGVVFHIFLERERDYYNLEGLWSQARVIYRGETEPDMKR